jgi:eukaryotic-like serine/threonine-protein kinase
MLMEFVDGDTLRAKILRRDGYPYSINEGLQIITPVCSALHYAHRQGLVHCDVKPANVMIDKSGRVLVADFGIARLSEGATTATMVGAGTPAYMAPEQIQGRDPTPQMDIYSTGIVLYEMLSGGHRPFTGEHVDSSGSTMDRVRWEHLHALPPSLRSLNPNVTSELEAVVMRCLAKNPEARYRSVLDLLQALQATTSVATPVIEGVEKKASLPPILVEQAGPAAPVLPPHLIGAKTKKPLVTNPLLWVSIVGLIAVVAIIAGLLGKVKETPSIPLGVGSTEIAVKDHKVMMYVPEGNFLMGAVDVQGELDSRPQRTVTLDAFWIDQTEVTNAMFSKFVNEQNYVTDAQKSGTAYVFTGNEWTVTSGADWKHPQGPAYNIDSMENFPVVAVSWNDAQAYCTWAGRRMATEAEWEKAARGTQAQNYPWGDLPASGQLANFADVNLNSSRSNPNINDGFEFTSPVGTYLSGQSPYGAMDMAGNAIEWVGDWYDAGYYFNGETNNPVGPISGMQRVLLGGSWADDSGHVRTDFRSWNAPNVADNTSGFRCAQSIQLVKFIEPSPKQPYKTGSIGRSSVDGMNMVYIPEGDFLMGLPDGQGYADNRPQHTVYLDAYWIDQTEVTNEEFSTFVTETKYLTDVENGAIPYTYSGIAWVKLDGASWKNPTGYGSTLSGFEKHPVIFVSWVDAKAYCEWAGKRLPTEAEWEKAARGTEGQVYPWGFLPPNGKLANFGDSSTDYSWSDKTTNDGYATTAPVGSYPDGKSVYGLLDMAGNANEWVADWYGSDYYLSSPSSNPTGPMYGDFRSLRGGPFFGNLADLRSATRAMDGQNSARFDSGFRCAQSEPR